MKKTVAIFFTLLILLPVIEKSLTFIWFKANQEYLAGNFCINKNNKKRKDCAGCCYLNDQLNKVDDSSANATGGNKENKEKTEFQWVYCLTQFLSVNICNQTNFLFDISSETQGKDQFMVDILKPPCRL